MNISVRLLCVAALALCRSFSNHLYSQAVYGNIVGTVTDPSKRPTAAVTSGILSSAQISATR